MLALPVALALLLLVNLLTILRFRDVKRRAVAGAWRVPESTLLGLAALGGSPAALLACRLFRHKTRKQPFATLLLLIAAIQAGALIGFLLG
ncbi:MAG TPA: DUF1294 domain-containing protein [Allosphingosinicella sp.]|jgi:uncharacterized membrane protein YsdA (DUF1294 family)|nr:DUF1294 domain-containing protein [Allosphingosinicella sp.]